MPTALITGASKGIGRAIAEEFARRGINLLLTARDETLLQRGTDELISKYGIRVAFLALDLTSTDAATQLASWAVRQAPDLNILVNNAGYGLSGNFEKYSALQHEEMMQVNMNVPLELCLLLLPHLRRQEKGYILNVSSSAAYQAVPGLTVYAASKSFMLSFSRGLRYELRKTNISVTAVCPGATDTDFPKRAQVGAKAQKAADKFNMKPEEVAKQAVEAMFAEKAEYVTGVVNKLGAFLAWLFPKSMAEKAAAGIYEL